MSIHSEERPHNSYAIFRAHFPHAGKLHLYAEDCYELYLNEKFVAFGPARSREPLCYYDSFECSGEDTVIAIKVHCREGRPGVYCMAFDANGRGIRLDWRCMQSKAYLSCAPSTNVGSVGFTEYYDFSAIEDEWYKLHFNDSHFIVPEYARGIKTSHFLPRPIPMFAPACRKPVEITYGNGEFLADFGSIVFGRVVLHGLTDGSELIKLGYIESPDSGWAHTEGHRTMYEDRLFHPGREFEWRGFNKRGFRYLSVSGAISEIKELHVEEYLYPVTQIGEFKCSDSELNKLWDISIATLKVCMDDIYNDCPHRDQAQWMDAFVSSKVALGVFGVTDLTGKCLRQHAICSFEDGRFLSPSISGTSFMPDYALVLILFIRWYYQVTGDKELLQEIFGNVEEAMKHILGLQSPDHLIGNITEPHFLYLDNTFELCRAGKSAALNALYYGALNAMADICAILNKHDGNYRQEADYVRTAFKHFFERPDGCLRDSDLQTEIELRNINFSCELKKYTGSSALAEFEIISASDINVMLLSGAYAEYKIFCNSELIFEDKRKETWARSAPCYDLNHTEIPLKQGINKLCFETKHNMLNWDLFLFSEVIDFEACEINESDWETGRATGNKFKIHPLPWFPPHLSQSTHGYAAYCGLLNGTEVLTKTIPSEYYRNYKSIRVPDFCRETSNRKELKTWIMPCNTPWTAFFYLSSLFECGLSSEALAWLRMAWGCMLKGNAVNTWEEWGDNSSLCHAWGTSPAYFFQHDILGVKLERCFENIIEFRPDLCGLKSANGKIALSKNESISVELEKQEDKTLVKVEYQKGRRIISDLSRLETPELICIEKTN